MLIVSTDPTDNYEVIVEVYASAAKELEKKESED
jgi:hypothetical protein